MFEYEWKCKMRFKLTDIKNGGEKRTTSNNKSKWNRELFGNWEIVWRQKTWNRLKTYILPHSLVVLWFFFVFFFLVAAAAAVAIYCFYLLHVAMRRMRSESNGRDEIWFPWDTDLPSSGTQRNRKLTVAFRILFSEIYKFTYFYRVTHTQTHTSLHWLNAYH